MINGKYAQHQPTRVYSSSSPTSARPEEPVPSWFARFAKTLILAVVTGVCVGIAVSIFAAVWVLLKVVVHWAWH